jgi:hypothetical protein
VRLIVIRELFMKDISIAELAVFIIGLAIVIFSKWFGTRVIEVQQKYYGMKTARNDVRDSIIATATIGIIFVVVAVISHLELTSLRL